MTEVFAKVKQEMGLLDSLLKEVSLFQEKMMAHFSLSEKYFEETNKIVHEKTVRAQKVL